MIKIQEHLNRADADKHLEELAKSLWTSLNPKLKSGKGYKLNSLIEKCKKYKNQDIPKDYLQRYAGGDLIRAQRQKDFFSYLLRNNSKELRRLIVSKPNEFERIKNDIYQILKTDDLVIGTPGNYSQTPFGVLLSETIFNYSAFRSSDFCKELFSKLGFDTTTCPYCNDNKLNIVKLRDSSSVATKLKAYLDIDHFYPKSLHPFFAVSFYNLIPTCHDCNAAEKGDKPFTIATHINPYVEAFDDHYIFKISLKSLLGDPIDYIEIKKISAKHRDTTVEDLNLNSRYLNNLKIAAELVDLFWKYKGYIGTKSEADFAELLLRDIPRERKNILKHQRAKMNRDILKQIDIDRVLKIV